MKTGLGLAFALAAGVSMAAGARYLGAPRAEPGEAVAVVELGVVPGADNELRAKRLAYWLSEPGTTVAALRSAALPEGAPWTAEDLCGSVAGAVEARLDAEVLWVSIHVRTGPVAARALIANALAEYAAEAYRNKAERRVQMRRTELDDKITMLNGRLRIAAVDKRHVIETSSFDSAEAERLAALRGDLGADLNALERARLASGEALPEAQERAERLREALAELDERVAEATSVAARVAELDGEIEQLKADKATAARERERISGLTAALDGELRIVRSASTPSE